MGGKGESASEAPHKDFSALYEKMSGKGESASEAHLRLLQVGGDVAGHAMEDLVRPAHIMDQYCILHTHTHTHTRAHAHTRTHTCARAHSLVKWCTGAESGAVRALISTARSAGGGASQVGSKETCSVDKGHSEFSP